MSQPGCTVDVQRPPGGPGGIRLPYAFGTLTHHARGWDAWAVRTIRRLRGVRVSLGACEPLGRQRGPPTAVPASG